MKHVLEGKNFVYKIFGGNKNSQNSYFENS